MGTKRPLSYHSLLNLNNIFSKTVNFIAITNAVARVKHMGELTDKV